MPRLRRAAAFVIDAVGKLWTAPNTIAGLLLGAAALLAGFSAGTSGRALAKAISSLIDFTGRLGFTMRTYGWVDVETTGSNAVRTSKGTRFSAPTRSSVSPWLSSV